MVSETGGSVTDFGHRVGQATTLGNESSLQLGGYIVIAADDMVHATQLAKDCPGLQNASRCACWPPTPRGPDLPPHDTSSVATLSQ